MRYSQNNYNSNAPCHSADYDMLYDRASENHTSKCHSSHESPFACQCAEMPMPDVSDSFPSLAMVYSPFQVFRDIYTPQKALSRGTLFLELDKPWKAGGCK